MAVADVAVGVAGVVKLALADSPSSAPVGSGSGIKVAR